MFGTAQSELLVVFLGGGHMKFLHTRANKKCVQAMICCPPLQLGMLALPCNLATGELVLWTAEGWGSLGEVGYVELASALRLASAWSHCGSTL